MAGIYLHIPFCKQACHYCDFHFTTNLKMKSDLIDGMVKEIKFQKDFFGGQTLESIYFGGGSPSLLSEKELSKLLEEINNYFVFNNPEITLEANPDDLSK